MPSSTTGIGAARGEAFAEVATGDGTTRGVATGCRAMAKGAE
jgi:hypothetical protein